MTGVEDCCDVIKATLFVVCYTPHRIVFYDPNNLEYARFAEAPEFSSFDGTHTYAFGALRCAHMLSL